MVQFKFAFGLTFFAIFLVPRLEARDVVISFQGGIQSVLDDILDTIFPDDDALVGSLVGSLQLHAQVMQAPVIVVLEAQAILNPGMEIHSFWISNEIIVNGIDNVTLQLITDLGLGVTIRDTIIIALPPLIPSPPPPATDVQWGVERVGAPSVWSSGSNGNGIKAGIIDTGVRATHEILTGQIIGFYDPDNPTNFTAYDDDGHGTHVSGTVAGKNGYGVAPGAKIIMCRGCTSDGCPDFNLKTCAQFMICPTLFTGNSSSCNQKKPKVINNSWGGPGGNFDFYKAEVAAWQAAKIVPVFSAGNSGPNCSTAGSPGDYPNVIGVGATDINNTLAWFSSRGPTVDGRMKPDLSAPGHQIKSASYLADNAYVVESGTSMAAPHTTGVIALMFGQNSGLTYNQVLSVLQKCGTKKGVITVTSTETTCPGLTQYPAWPNNNYGYGLANAVGAVFCAPHPTICPSLLPLLFPCPP